MTPILFRATARYHRRHPWQLALALLGITLGVAVVVAVDVATVSARRAFTLAAEAVSGRATHEITGGPAGLPEHGYGAVLAALAGRGAAAPVIDRYVELPAHGRRVLRLIGVDPFAEAPFRGLIGPGATADGMARAASAPFDMAVLLTRRSIVLTRATAAALRVEPGDTLLVRAAGRTLSALLAGTLDPQDALSRRALAELALTDIATAQEIAGAAGVLDRIELVLPADAAAALGDRVRAALPPGARLLPSGARTAATARLTRAFETNLRALALVALVFGMFLIYNAATFAVVQRRPLFGLLRAQGVTGRELFVLVIAEAAVLAVVATALGVLSGAILGRELVRLVARTINDLYFAVTVGATTLSPGTLVRSIALGVSATVLAAAWPALEAVRTPPRAVLARASLERRAARAASPLAAAGGVAAALAWLLLLLPSRSLMLGFTALFVLILAAALLTPAATTILMRLIRPASAALGTIGRMAPRGVVTTLSRTAPAIAALAVAIAVGFAVTIMIASFRGGVVRWLGRALPADIYLAVPEPGSGRTTAALAPDLVRDVRAVPGVAGVSTYRHALLLVDDRLTRLIAVAMDPRQRAAFTFLEGDAATAWAAFRQGAVFVSESYAYTRAVRAGDTVSLPTDRGATRFPVAAVYRDYASEHGVIFIDRDSYNDWWRDDAVTSLGIFLAPAADVDSVLSRVRALPSAGGAIARATGTIREGTLQVFDRTFAITGVLRLLALLVAFVGVTGALMALQLERAREVGVLRAVGLTPAQVWQLLTAQTALMGTAAAALALPLGLALAWAMVHVINRRSFGWTFDLVIGPLPFAQAFAIGVGAAVIAGLYPAWRMARLRPAAALREE